MMKAPAGMRLCGNCRWFAMLREGTWICLARSATNPPFILAVEPHNDGNMCELWDELIHIEIPKNLTIQLPTQHEMSRLKRKGGRRKGLNTR